MTLADDVNLEEFVMTKDEFSGADIKAICTEAGLLALRERRMKVRQIPALRSSRILLTILGDEQKVILYCGFCMKSAIFWQFELGYLDGTLVQITIFILV